MDSFLAFDELSERAQETLRAEEALDHLYQGVVVSDPALDDNPIVYANDAFLRLTGYRRDEIVGYNCRFLQGAGTDASEIARLRDALHARTSFFGELLNYCRDGAAFWNALSITPLLARDGGVRYYIASQTDITSIKELELRAAQQQRLELLGAFSGGIAHDFNNVLLATSGYAELLSRKLADDPELQAYAERITAAASSGQRLTAQLLAFSRGDGEEQTERVDVAAVVAQTVSLASRLMPAGVSVEVDLAAGGPVRSTRSQIEQVALNLIVNARDAIEGGGTITVATHEQAGELVLSVADTGVGMTPEVRARIFETFFTTKASGKGTGLGLATVSQIVEKIGGAIDVASEPGAGTTFSIALPIDR